MSDALLHLVPVRSREAADFVPAGTTALAAAISCPPTSRAPGTTPAPAPTAAKTATRSR
ncbi:hypothetical protein [Streptomyces hawaiiensis]|uniref:hypothetical protein n=1 Tax=Streptomyces hawaiiensis TaxID=67305 RepID=UPI00366266A2